MYVRGPLGSAAGGTAPVGSAGAAAAHGLATAGAGGTIRAGGTGGAPPIGAAPYTRAYVAGVISWISVGGISMSSRNSTFSDRESAAMTAFVSSIHARICETGRQM